MFAFMVITMTLIVFTCAMAWLSSEALRNWSELPKYRMLEREQGYERAQRRNGATPPRPAASALRRRPMFE